MTFSLSGAFTFTIAETNITKNPRPGIAVVLSGGGARGLAHIGVLKALEEMRIPIDCIVGTSMGALVGGIYATGIPPVQIENIIAKNDLESLFNDLPPRADRPYKIKEYDYYPLFDISVGVNSNGIQLPPGASAGYKFELFIKEIIGLDSSVTNLNFDTLPTPYRAMATNLENGQLKVFSNGDLARIMRASMSLPAVINPVIIDGKTYIDGGLVDNLPVEVGRKLCGDIVIAVNLGSKPKKIKNISSSFDVAEQSYLILSEQNISQSIKSLTSNDILISPELTDIGSDDFSNHQLIINKGITAAQAQKDKLAIYSVSPQQYRQWLAKRHKTKLDKIRVKSISARSTGKVNNKVVMRDITTKPGDGFNLKQLNNDLSKLYARGDFSYVGYSVVVNDSDSSDADIIVNTISKPWGPDYLKFGFEVATDFNTPTQFNLAASYRKTWVNSLGAEWRTDMQLGYNSFLTTELIQPLQIRDGAFITPYTGIHDGKIQFYQGNLRIGEFEISRFNIGLDIGVTNKYGEIKLGPYFDRVQTKPDFGLLTPIFRKETTSQVGFRLNAIYDQLDSLEFPRTGSRASTRIMATRKNWGSDEEYTLAQLKFSSAVSFEQHSLLAHLELGDDISNTNDLPTYLAFKLGGPGKLSGLNLGQLTGTRYSLATLNYYYQYDKLHSQLGKGMYMGMSLEQGRINDAFLDDSSAFITSGSVFWGADTVLGSIYIGYGLSSLKQNTYYLLISNNYF